MVSSEELRWVMEWVGVALLVFAWAVPFAAETARDRWAMSFPTLIMAVAGVVLITLS